MIQNAQKLDSISKNKYQFFDEITTKRRVGSSINRSVIAAYNSLCGIWQSVLLLYSTEMSICVRARRCTGEPTNVFLFSLYVSTSVSYTLTYTLCTHCATHINADKNADRRATYINKFAKKRVDVNVRLAAVRRALHIRWTVKQTLNRSQ